MSNTIEDRTGTSTEAMERRRDELALAVRHNPALLDELEAVEAQLAKRLVEGQRGEAASREEARRAQEAAQKAEEAETHRKERVLQGIRHDLGQAASEVEDLLPPLIEALRKVIDGVNARSDAGVQLGHTPDYTRGRSVVASRIQALLGELLPSDFSRSLDSRHREQRLEVLLGVSTLRSER